MIYSAEINVSLRDPIFIRQFGLSINNTPPAASNIVNVAGTNALPNTLDLVFTGSTLLSIQAPNTILNIIVPIGSPVLTVGSTVGNGYAVSLNIIKIG
ncbi:hypothetical protein ACQVTS_27235 [Bacillus mycoides]|uniref:hypothetical protein n=1 Tax=Bacillus mycoides TaxID=1405 RepID=UPI003D65FF71